MRPLEAKRGMPGEPAVACLLGAVLVLMLAPGAVASRVDINVLEGQALTGNVVKELSCPLASARWSDAQLKLARLAGG